MAVDARDAALSYYRIRQALGALGLALPALLIAGSLALGDPLPPALSDYWHTPLRDLFVGAMFAIGTFLVSYVGHTGGGGLLNDRNVSTLAGIGALGVALFPNETVDPCAGLMAQATLLGALHVASAGLFLIATCAFCLVLFRRSNGPRSPAKRRRDRVYLACGAAILVALALLGAWFLAPTEARCALRPWRPVLWLEIVTVWAFGLAWLVKGRGLQAVGRALETA